MIAPGSPITAENSGLLRAGDVVEYIGYRLAPFGTLMAITSVDEKGLDVLDRGEENSFYFGALTDGNFRIPLPASPAEEGGETLGPAAAFWANIKRPEPPKASAEEVAGALRRVQQDMDDVVDVWRHCRIAMVNSSDTDEVVGFPSFGKTDLRLILSDHARLSQQIAELEAREAGDRDAIIALVEHFERVDGDARHKAIIAQGTARLQQGAAA